MRSISTQWQRYHSVYASHSKEWLGRRCQVSFHVLRYYRWADKYIPLFSLGEKRKGPSVPRRGDFWSTSLLKMSPWSMISFEKSIAALRSFFQFRAVTEGENVLFFGANYTAKGVSLGCLRSFCRARGIRLHVEAGKPCASVIHIQTSATV